MELIALGRESREDEVFARTAGEVRGDPQVFEGVEKARRLEVALGLFSQTEGDECGDVLFAEQEVRSSSLRAPTIRINKLERSPTGRFELCPCGVRISAGREGTLPSSTTNPTA